jgi:hypothetical protein
VLEPAALVEAERVEDLQPVVGSLRAAAPAGWLGCTHTCDRLAVDRERKRRGPPWLSSQADTNHARSIRSILVSPAWGAVMAAGISAGIAAAMAYIVARGTAQSARERLRAELRTEFMSEEAIRALLTHEKWTRRSFRIIRYHIRGFDDDELRKMLVSAGAVATRSSMANLSSTGACVREMLTYSATCQSRRTTCVPWKMLRANSRI